MTELPMFPLGSVLFPHMPLQLRVFEERYLVMITRMLEAEESDFGVVLIERGQEVGGGEHRFGWGTKATITQLGTGEGLIVLVAEGGSRFEVEEWLTEDPHPIARVRELPDLEWNEDFAALRARAEAAVRRSLALASEFSEQAWAADVEVSDDPVAAVWQLAGILPVNPLDQMAMMRAGSMELLLEMILENAQSAAETIAAPWDDPEFDEDDEA